MIIYAAHGFCAVQLELELLGWVWVRNTADLHISGIQFCVNIIGMVGTWNTVDMQLGCIPNSNSAEKLNL